MKKVLRCPKCDQDMLTRIARRGFFRNHIFPIFGYYPWECSGCRREVLVRQRGGAYRKSSRSGEAISDEAVVGEGSRAR